MPVDGSTVLGCRPFDLELTGTLTGVTPFDQNPTAHGVKKIILGENLEALAELPDGFAQLVYIDPPFNTGRSQTRERMKVHADDAGERLGFGGKRYRVERVGASGYADRFDDYVGFLMPRIEASLRCLEPRGSLFVHLDAREVHYVKVALDELLGREAFMNEIVWAYDYGGQTEEPLAQEARHHPLVRQEPGRLRVPPRRHRSHSVHGAASGRPRKGGTRQDADRRLVAHDRADERPRKNGVRDAEAARHL